MQRRIWLLFLGVNALLACLATAQTRHPIPRNNSAREPQALAAAQAAGKWGFIDKTGKFVVPPRYDSVWSFAEQLASVSVGGKWGFIDKTGKLVIPAQFDSAWIFSEQLAPVSVGGKWAFIDKTGKFV